MSENPEGKTDEAIGRVKEAAGALTDDDELRGEGKLDQLTGALKKKSAELIDDARDRVKDALGGGDDEEADEDGSKS